MRKSPDNFEARLAAWAMRVAAGVRVPGSEASFAPGVEAVAVPDLAAPGFISFMGGPAKRALGGDGPFNVLASQGGLYAELDEGIPGPQPSNDGNDPKDAPVIRAQAEGGGFAEALGPLARGAAGLREKG